MGPSFQAANIWWWYSDHMEIFQTHIVVEMTWAPPDCFLWGKFSFNLYIYYLTRAFNLLTRAFNLPTRVFNLATRAFSLLTHGFELVTHEFEPLTRGSQLVTGFELITCRFKLVICISELVTRNLHFTFPYSIFIW